MGRRRRGGGALRALLSVHTRHDDGLPARGGSRRNAVRRYGPDGPGPRGWRRRQRRARLPGTPPQRPPGHGRGCVEQCWPAVGGQLVPRIPGLLRQPHRSGRLASAIRVLVAARQLALRRRRLSNQPWRRRRSAVGLRHRSATAGPAAQRPGARGGGGVLRGHCSRRLDPRGRRRRRARRGVQDLHRSRPSRIPRGRRARALCTPRRRRRKRHRSDLDERGPRAAECRDPRPLRAARNPHRSDSVQHGRGVHRRRLLPRRSERAGQNTGSDRDKRSFPHPSHPIHQRSRPCQADTQAEGSSPPSPLRRR